MSVIVIVIKQNEVCIGTDTLAKFGNLKEPAEYIANPSKIEQIGDCYVGIAGHASCGMILRRFVSQKGELPVLQDCDSIFSFALDLHVMMKEECFLNPDEDNASFESSRYQMLLATPSGAFGIYECRSVQQYTRFYAIGSGDEFAMGAMHAVYNQYETGVDIARAGLEAASEFDDGCGPPFEFKCVKMLT